MSFRETLNKLQQKFNQLRIPQQPCLDGHHCPEYWAGDHRHYARYWDEYFHPYPAGTTITLDRIKFAPMQVAFTITVDRLGVCVIAANGNIRMALYHDNGDTPDGGALIVETASVAAAINRNEFAIANTQLTPGLYWLALNNDDATLNCIDHDDQQAGGGTLQVRWANQAYGAFPALAPATNSSLWYTIPWMFTRIASVP